MGERVATEHKIDTLEKVFEAVLSRRGMPLVLHDREVEPSLVAKGDGLLPAFLLEAVETWNHLTTGHATVKLEKDKNAIMFVRASEMPKMPPFLLYPLMDFLVEKAQTPAAIVLDPVVDRWFGQTVEASPEFVVHSGAAPELNVEGLRA